MVIDWWQLPLNLMSLGLVVFFFSYVFKAIKVQKTMAKKDLEYMQRERERNKKALYEQEQALKKSNQQMQESEEVLNKIRAAFDKEPGFEEISVVDGDGYEIVDGIDFAELHGDGQVIKVYARAAEDDKWSRIVEMMRGAKDEVIQSISATDFNAYEKCPGCGVQEFHGFKKACRRLDKATRGWQFGVIRECASCHTTWKQY